MRSARGRAALLLFTLIALGIILSTVSLGLSSPLLGFVLNIPQPAPPPGSTPPAPGELLVAVSLYGAGHAALPVPGAVVSIGSGVPGYPSVLLTTNSSGEVEIPLGQGDYSLTVSDPEFSAFRDVTILSSTTTVAAVSVDKQDSPLVFSDLSDEDGSGFVGPWQQISVAVNSSSAKTVLSSDVFFLDALYAPNSTGGQGSTSNNGSALSKQVRAVVLSEPADPSAPGLLVFIVQPTTFISIRGLTSLSIATYTASIRVTMVGP